MVSFASVSARAAARPIRSRTADAAVFVGTAALVWLLVRVASGASVPWTVETAPPSVSTDPANLPYYAARSLLRMFIALGVSIVFTFVYATAAARSRRAEKVGVDFTTADIRRSKQIFAAQARERAPLVRTVCRALGASADGTLRAGFFLDVLRRGFGPEDARRQLDTAVDWGRYGELYDYDAETEQITADPAAGIYPRIA